MASRNPAAQGKPPWHPSKELDDLARDVLGDLKDDWVATELPMLGGRAPAEVVGDPDGERVVTEILHTIIVGGA